jgi:isopentenyl-diphosphate delta-isomerase
MSADPATDVELVVLLGGDHKPVGTMDKALVHGPDTPLHLAFSVYVFGPDGRFLLTRRALGKRTWGGVWTNSCCGHPGPGEDVEAAARRRLGQELSLEGVVEHEVCPVFVAEVDADPVPDEDEVAQWRWVDWSDFQDLAARHPWALSPWSVEQAALLP